jgi:outer membrane protein TolC
MNRKIASLNLALLIILTQFGGISFAETQGTTAVADALEVNVEGEEIIALDLNNALDYALQNSKEMILERLKVEKAKIIYDYNIDAVEKAEKALDIDIPVPRTYEVTPDSNVNRNLLRNGASEKSIELAYQVAKWNLETTENRIRYNVEKSYYDLVLAWKELQIAEENLKLLNKQYDHGKLRYDLGLISRQQLLGLDLNLSQATSGLDAAKMYYELQMMNFKNTIGLPLSTKILLTGEIIPLGYEPIDIDASIDTALTNNAGIKVAEENLEISKLTLDAKNIKGMGIYYRYKEQEAITQEAEINLDSAKKGIEMLVRSSVMSLQIAEKQIATFELAVQQATEALRIAELSFELGQNTPTEIAQANINLMNTKMSLAQQIHAYNLALLDFEYSTGIGK